MVDGGFVAEDVSLRDMQICMQISIDVKLVAVTYFTNIIFTISCHFENVIS